MNQINKRFLFFKTESAFRDSLEAKEEIRDDSIVFIADKHAIWTHGEMFGTEGDHAKGFFKSVQDLPKDGRAGDWAIVNVDGKWYMFTYTPEIGWIQGEEYEFSNNVPIDMDEIYVRKDNIRNFIRNLYDNIYVKKSEVYTPEGDWISGGDDKPGGNGGPSELPSIGLAYPIDSKLDERSINPVANWVIVQALKKYATLEQVSDIANSVTSKPNLDNYYTKDDTYNKLEIDNQLNKLEQLIRVVGLSIRIVDELPNIGEERILYMVSSDAEENIYDMWVWSDGQWAQFGTYKFDVNLEQYLTKAEFESYIGNSESLKDFASKKYVDDSVQTIKKESQDYIDLAVKNSVIWDDVYTPENIAPNNNPDNPGYNPYSNKVPQSGGKLYVTYDYLNDVIDLLANSITIDNQLNTSSTNPVANYIIAQKFAEYLTKEQIDETIKKSLSSYATKKDISKTIEDAIDNVNLSNYYTKDKVYSKDETYSKYDIDSQLKSLEELIRTVGLSIEIVDEKPEFGRERILYMVSTGTEEITYDMWIYQSGEWRHLGAYEFNIDLSEYLTKEDFNSYMNNSGNIHDIIKEDVLPLIQDLISEDKAKEIVNKAKQEAVDTATDESKVYTDEQLSDVVRWKNVYTPEDYTLNNNHDAPGYNPSAGKVPSTGVRTYVTHEELNTIIDLLGNNGVVSSNVPKHIILEQEEYDALSVYEHGALYFVLEPGENIDTNWTFGGTFPVIFAAEGLGTFPINLK